jgi:prepilin-type N-terminal cleavage/methylation domain-containing protein/prepilin-type processing-associated H-X9-DG protein
MWKRTKGFTLMELLVVIAVIALLLAVLMPSLRKAKEMAGRIVCGNHEKQLLLANNLYANSWDEQFCPPMMENRNAKRTPPPDERRYIWLTNKDFQKFMALDDQAEEGIGGLQMPDEYYCPADKLARYDDKSEYGVIVSYAYNVADWDGNPKPALQFGCYWKACCNCTSNDNPTWQIGHKRPGIRRASEKINFIDSCDWWATWGGANYVDAWDLCGQIPGHHATKPCYRDYGIYGPTLYRHNEGANVGFYDGHVEWMPKEKVYVFDGSKSIPPEQDATGMWFCFETWAP